MESQYAAKRPMKLLYELFAHGDLVDYRFAVDIPAFKKADKIKNSHLLFMALGDYGFAFSGLTNDKITPNSIELTIDYPDNPNVIIVMAQVSGKAAKVNADEMFYRWSFRRHGY